LFFIAVIFYEMEFAFNGESSFELLTDRTSGVSLKFILRLKQQIPSSGGIACWNCRRDRFERDGGAIDVPEIAVRLCEFDGDLPASADFRVDKDYAAFALFFGEAIHDKDLLAEFYGGLHLEQPAM
jgi:hypothetical protein